MSWKNRKHRFSLQMLCPVPGDRTRQLRFTFPLDKVDWRPLLECARWSDVLAFPRPPIYLETSDAVVRPNWDEQRGRPFVTSVHVSYPEATGQSRGITVPVSYFHPTAQQIASELAERGVVTNGQVVPYDILAHQRTTESGSSDHDSSETARVDGSRQGGESSLGGDEPDVLSVEPIREPLLIERMPLGPLLANSRATGEDDSSPMPTFVPEQILQQIIRKSMRTRTLEVAGLLIGHVGYDSDREQLFTVVTGQLPARASEQTATSVRFTPDSWALADRDLAARGGNEIYLGWWHSHPARHWQTLRRGATENANDHREEEDPPSSSESNRVTTVGPGPHTDPDSTESVGSEPSRAGSGEFFSMDDRSLHRCCFARAYNVGLVISDSPDHGVTTPLFGWSGGMLVRREFHVLSDQFTLKLGYHRHA